MVGNGVKMIYGINNGWFTQCRDGLDDPNHNTHGIHVEKHGFKEE